MTDGAILLQCVRLYRHMGRWIEWRALAQMEDGTVYKSPGVSCTKWDEADADMRRAAESLPLVAPIISVPRDSPVGIKLQFATVATG